MPPIFHARRRSTGRMWIAGLTGAFLSLSAAATALSSLSSSGCALSLLAGLACVLRRERRRHCRVVECRGLVTSGIVRTSGLSRSSGSNTVTSCSVASLAPQLFSAPAHHSRMWWCSWFRAAFAHPWAGCSSFPALQRVLPVSFWTFFLDKNNVHSVCGWCWSWYWCWCRCCWLLLVLMLMEVAAAAGCSVVDDGDVFFLLILSLIVGCQCQHTNISALPKTLHGLSCIIQQPRSGNRVSANDQLTQSLTPCVRGTCTWATLTRKAAV